MEHLNQSGIPEYGKPRMPRFSVITPSYNQAQFIRRTIESVLEQSGGKPNPDIEHIIADGGSTDATVEILKEYPHLIWFSEKDRGQSDALNKGIARATGEWIVWINSDDYLLPGALDALKNFLREKPGAQFVFSDCTFVDEHGAVLSTRPAFYHEDPSALYHWWRRGAGIGQPGSFFRRALWEKYGPFDIHLHYTMDFDFWLKISADVPLLHMPGHWATYRLHGASKTLEGWKPFTLEHIRVENRYWDQRGGLWNRLKFRFLLRLMFAKKLVLEGIRAWDGGDRGRAWTNWREALLHQPMAFALSRPFVSFVLQAITGRPYWTNLREAIKKSDPLA